MKTLCVLTDTFSVRIVYIIWLLFDWNWTNDSTCWKQCVLSPFASKFSEE
jgi:hypothetical protein